MARPRGIKTIAAWQDQHYEPNDQNDATRENTTTRRQTGELFSRRIGHVGGMVINF
jgi:hypothetical protein